MGTSSLLMRVPCSLFHICMSGAAISQRSCRASATLGLVPLARLRAPALWFSQGVVLVFQASGTSSQCQPISIAQGVLLSRGRLLPRQGSHLPTSHCPGSPLLPSLELFRGGPRFPDLADQQTHRSPRLLRYSDPEVLETPTLPSVSHCRPPWSHRRQCLLAALTRSGFRRRSPPSSDTLASIPTQLGFSVSGGRFRTHAVYVRFSVAAFRSFGDRTSGSWSRASQTTGTWHWANPGQAHENPRHSAPVPVDQGSRPLQGMDNQRANPRTSNGQIRQKKSSDQTIFLSENLSDKFV